MKKLTTNQILEKYLSIIIGLLLLFFVLSISESKDKQQKKLRIDKLREHSIFYQDTVVKLNSNMILKEAGQMAHLEIKNKKCSNI